MSYSDTMKIVRLSRLLYHIAGIWGGNKAELQHNFFSDQPYNLYAEDSRIARRYAHEWRAYNNQNFQKMEQSTESVLSTTMSLLEDDIQNGGFSLGLFLDIEGAGRREYYN